MISHRIIGLAAALALLGGCSTVSDTASDVGGFLWPFGGDDEACGASMDRRRLESRDLRPSSDRRPTRNPRSASATASDVTDANFLALASSFANRCGDMPRWP